MKCRHVSDCSSLVQHIQFSTVIGVNKVLEKRLAMDLAVLKDELASEKYLKDKSIDKIIFVKNRLINLLINE